MSDRHAFLVVVEPHDDPPPDAPAVDAALVAAALAGHAGLLLHRITVDTLELDIGTPPDCYGGEPCAHCPDPAACGEASGRRAIRRTTDR